MPSPNLIDASKTDKNKKVLRGEKAKKVLSKMTKKEEDKKEIKRKASEVRQKMYGKD